MRIRNRDDSANAAAAASPTKAAASNTEVSNDAHPINIAGLGHIVLTANNSNAETFAKDIVREIENIQNARITPIESPQCPIM